MSQRYSIRLLCYVLVFGCLFMPTAHAEPKRLALVIGNANYVQGDVLPNDINDADDMAALLQQYNFSVIKKTDATLKDMFDGLREFKQALQQSPDRVGLFYYSGHGLEVDGTQYIIPINAQPHSETELPAHAIAVNTVLKEMGEGKEQLNVVILDACRNNPFSKAFAIKSLSKGFSPISNAPRGTLIASATAAGDTSSANGSRNSVYTAQLLKFLREQPNDEIRLVLSDVRKAVLDNTQDGQMPWTSESMTGRFFLVPPTNTVNQPVQAVIAPVSEIKPPVSEPSAPVQQTSEPIPETKPPVLRVERDGVVATQRVNLRPTPVSETTTPDAQKRLVSMEAEMLAIFKVKGSAKSYYQQNCTKELTFWQENAQRNNPIAQNLLASCYEYGEGVTKSDTEALNWYRKAAEQGNANGQNNLGNMYKYGSGITKSYTEALNWYRKVAEQGNAIAQYNLGDMYQSGDGVTQSYADAVNWYRKAAEQGFAVAQCVLAQFYQSGDGVTQSDAEAVSWYLKAAEQGNALAQLNLGKMYENGDNITQSDTEAMNWYRKAAEQDDSYIKMVARQQLSKLEQK